MKLKSTILFYLLIFAAFYVNGQSNSSTRLISPKENGFVCGGNIMEVQISGATSNFEPSPNQQFYLLISSLNTTNFKDSIPSFKDLSLGTRIIFRLPDTLKIGRKYKVKLRSIGSNFISETNTFTFGSGKLPYKMEFLNLEEYVMSSTYNVKVQASEIAGGASILENDYKIKFSNGLIIDFHYADFGSYSYLKLPIYENKNIFKIQEITNSCGVSGESNSELNILKASVNDLLLVKLIGNGDYVCENSKIKLKVLNIDKQKKVNYLLELSTDNNFSKYQTLQATLKTDTLEFDAFKGLSVERTYYYRVRTSDDQFSNSGSFYYFRQYHNATLNGQITSDNKIQLSVNLTSSNNINVSSQLGVNSLYINGKILEEQPNYIYKIVVPNKDSTFRITKIDTQCGELKIIGQPYFFSAKKEKFIDIEVLKNSYCEDESITFKIKNDISSFRNKLFSRGDILTTVKKFDETLNDYIVNGGEFVRFNTPSGVIDTVNNTIKFKISTDLTKYFESKYGNSKYRISGIVFYPIFESRVEDSIRINYNIFGTNILLKPKVVLTSNTVISANQGFVNIPVKYYGNGISKLVFNNGQTFTINLDNYCYDCLINNVYDIKIPISLDGNTVLSIKSIENNTCQNATFAGETRIIIEDKKKIEIDNSKIPEFFCGSGNFKVPIKLLGNWSVNEYSFKLVVKYFSSYTNTQKTYSYDVSGTEPSFFIQPSFGDYQVEFYIESRDGIKSETVKMALLNKPQMNGYYALNRNYLIENQVEVFNVTASSPEFSASLSGYFTTITVNNKEIKYRGQSSSYSYFNILSKYPVDTLLTINSIQNACGTVDINKKIRIKSSDYAFKEVYDYTSLLVNNSSFQNCKGSKRIIKFSYVDNVKPIKDSVVVQLARKTSNLGNLRFFDVPSSRNGDIITYFLPDSIIGDIVCRIRSYDNKIFSHFLYFSNTNSPVSAKFATIDGKNNALANPSVNLALFLEKTTDLDFMVTMNDGTVLSSYDFGLLQYSSQANTPFIKNNGRLFYPQQNIIYSVKNILNSCGLGKVSGNVDVKIATSLIPSVKGIESKSIFCTGDSLEINLKYLGAFPKDTLMGVYLHSTNKTSTNVELVRFKSNPSNIKLKLPNDVLSGEYLLQLRKVSRSKLYKLYYKNAVDSVVLEKNKEQFDTDFLSIIINSKPNLELIGNSTIMAGQSAKLFVFNKNNTGTNELISRDTINNYLYPLFLTLSNGQKISLSSNMFKLLLSKSETITIEKVQNYCGIGVSSGKAQINVIPISSNRIEFIGFPRENYYSYINSTSSFSYPDFGEFCTGTLDSVDIGVYGVSNFDASNLRLQVKEASGNKSEQVTILKTAIISHVKDDKIVRLFIRIPENLDYGINYRFNVELLNNAVSSLFNNSMYIIAPKPTASLTGKFLGTSNEKPILPIKFTGTPPWLISVRDTKNNVVFSNLPTKKDSLNNFLDNYYQLFGIYEKNFSITLENTNTNTYNIEKVFNSECKLGLLKVNKFEVELITANELESNIEVTVYPNPTSETINVKANNLEGKINIEIYSSTGQKLYEVKLKEGELEKEMTFNDFPTGNYFLKVSNPKFSKTYRISKL